MSMLNFIWDAAQDGHIDELEEKAKQMESRIEVIEGWIRYLDARITDLEAQQKADHE